MFQEEALPVIAQAAWDPLALHPAHPAHPAPQVDQALHRVAVGDQVVGVLVEAGNFS